MPEKKTKSSDKPTKYYSDRQESAVANYLGWKQVSASGARPFNKGDVISERWLCECKTHTTVIREYKVLFSVWTKLLNESTSCMKRPVLIIDNGTQKIENQCAFVPKIFIPIDTFSYPVISEISDRVKIKSNTKSISFDVDVLSSMKKDKYCILYKVEGIEFVIMPIEIFRELVSIT